MSVVQTEQHEGNQKERQQQARKKQKTCKEEVDPVLQYPRSIICWLHVMGIYKHNHNIIILIVCLSVRPSVTGGQRKRFDLEREEAVYLDSEH